MRMWEFDDNRSNLVLEQDFILRLRRLHRLGTPQLVANICLSNIPSDYSGRGEQEDVKRRLQAMVLTQKGTYAEMTNGDAFLIWPANEMSKTFPEQAMMVTLPDGINKGDFEQYIKLFNLPEDYAKLRERANHYVNELRTNTSNDDSDSPERLLQSEATRGPLTAWSVSLIERLVKGIDLCQYIRSQTIYDYQKDESWKQWADETFVGLDDVKQHFFPHIDLKQPQHLFLQLSQTLDRNLLETLTLNYDSINDMNLNLNLSLHTVLGVEFAQFTHRISRGNRHKVGFEIHCGDLLEDFEQTINAFETLRQEDYHICIDGITPNMLPYINFTSFPVDYFKIKVSKDHAASLKSPAIREAISKAPHDKLIFFHCDNEQSLLAGINLGVTKFQGWLIDDKARE